MNSKRTLICWGALAIFVALLGATHVMASGGAAPLRQSGAPGQLNFQGFLPDPTTGDPVPDGDYKLTFAIYDHATSTDPSHRLWEETQTVSTRDGVFNVILGAVKPIDTTWVDGRDLWLGITVQGEDEMTPRPQLASVPYALNANDVRGTDIHPDNVYASHSVNVDSASVCGVGVSSASVCGVYVGLTSYGVYVDSASEDGVYVSSAGSPSTTSSSTDPNGFEVAGAEGDGLYVGRADEHGVSVFSAGNDGVSVFSAGNPSTTSPSTAHNGFEVAGAEGNGLYVGRADNNGVFVYNAGSPSTQEVSALDNGVEVAGAQGHGLFVGRADDSGVYVLSADDDGVFVDSAGIDGVYVGEADDDGMYVYSAGNPSTTSPSTAHNGFEVAGAEGSGLYVGQAEDGVYVYSAGNPSRTSSSDQHNGFEVAGAEGNGLYVGRADRGNGVWVDSAGDNGVYVGSAGWHGVSVGSAHHHGVYVGSADQDGVYVNSASGVGVYVNSAGVYAGYFNGDVYVSGTLYKGNLAFKIDHPLDPENKYLYHSSVESPDMMNVYNGNVTLDAEGEAWVELPAWFEALNQDYRYQLTPIGAPGPNLYIAQKIRDNRFQIAGGAPGMEVSWQVTGIRQDPYAEAHRIPVEEDKPAEERGTYLHPRAYGQPETMGLAYKEAQAYKEAHAPPPER